MKNIMCYGDSNTHGYDGATGGRFPWGVRWTSRVQEALKEENVRIIEEGQNGRTTVWEDPIEGRKSGLKYLLPCLESQSPLDIVVIMLGTNDMKMRFSLCAFDVAAGAETLVKAVKGYFADSQEQIPRILLVSPIEIRREVVGTHFSPMFGDERGVEMSGQLAPLYEDVARRQGCEFLNAAAAVTPGADDYIHLDAEGHKKLAEVITAKLRTML